MNSDLRVGAIYRATQHDSDEHRFVGIITSIYADGEHIEGVEMWIPIGKHTIGGGSVNWRCTRLVNQIAIMRDIVEVPASAGPMADVVDHVLERGDAFAAEEETHG